MKRILLCCLLLACGLLSLTLFGATPEPPRKSTAGPSVQVLAPMPIPGLDRERTIRVYLPPGYETGRKRYRVLYMFDGQNLFDDATSYIGEWGVDETLDALAKNEGIELIVVGIDHGNELRMRELSPWTNPELGGAPDGEAFMAFVVKRLKPYIDNNYRTKPGRQDTAIMGSSMGGLMTDYAVHQYPETFGMAGIFSPSYWISDDAYKHAAAHPLSRGTRIYLVAGGKEGDQMTSGLRKMEAQLRSEGKVQLYSTVREGAEHNEKFWHAELPMALRFLFGS
jgi:predicted alpha/beta superfamily hydrolase